MENQTNNIITYAFATLAARANEDRHSVKVAHGTSNCINDISVSKISSFGIFDGHNGSKAATYCAENLNNEVEHTYNELYDKTVEKYGEISLMDSDVDDGLMCHAIRSATDSINEKILKDNVSGTTSVTLYFKKSLATSSIRMYCANVGDSRAVMYTAINLNDNSLVQYDSSITSSIDFPDQSSHSIGSDSGSGSLSSSGYSGHNNSFDLSNALVMDENFVPNNIVLQSSLQQNDFNEPLTIYKGVSKSSDRLSPKGITNLSTVTGSRTPPGTPSSSGHGSNSNSKPKKRGKSYNNYVVLGHLISEDHKLQLQRERSRIETKSKVPEYVLPADASIIHSPIAAKGLSLRNYVVHDNTSGDVIGCGVTLQEPRFNTPTIPSNCAETISLLTDFSIFESNNCPDSLRLQKVENLLKSIISKAEFNEAIGSSSNKSTTDIDDTNTTSEPEPFMQIMHDDSFIMRRKLITENGVIMGPEALCGRHNLSIMMTRSIGDKYGPRSCAAVPDISAFTLPSEQHTRFIVASDGFWDVITVESVRVIVMSSEFKDSRELATRLTRKAASTRMRQNLRMDDISVLVVDYNIDKFVSINGGGKITRKSFNNLGKGTLPENDSFMDKCVIGTKFCSIS